MLVNHKIEQYLLDNDFECYCKDTTLKNSPKVPPIGISAVTYGIVRYWEKDNFIVIFGLSEHGKPPTVISPRPKNWSDDDMNKFLRENDCETIFNQFKDWGK